jgi:ParB/RepB/Spo0J family partition protein
VASSAEAKLAKAHTAAFEVLPLEFLDPHPDNPRIALRDDVVEAIAAQLVTGGFHPSHALRVRRVGARFQITSGHTRREAAKRAGLDEVPCWILDLDDEAAFMDLVLSNAQGELSPLEIGLHALKAVPKAQGKKGEGLAAYAEKIGKSKPHLTELRHAAEVFTDAGLFAQANKFMDLAKHLSEIHKAERPVLDADGRPVKGEDGRPKADRSLWSVLAARLVKHGWTVKETKASVEKCAEFVVPEAWGAWLPLVDVVDHYLETREFSPATVKRLCEAADEALAMIRGFSGKGGINVEAVVAAFTEWLVNDESSWDVRKVVERARALRADLEGMAEGAWLLGNWREHVSSLKDGSVALVLTDPPYGQGYRSDYRLDRTKAKKHDAIENDGDGEGAAELQAALTVMFPKLADDAHVLVFAAADGRLEAEAIRAVEAAGLTYRGTVFWDKQATGMGDPSTTFAPQVEQVVHAVKGSPQLFERLSTLQSFPRVSSERHPTEKPEALLARFIAATTAKGELVADPFGGVASTLAASKSVERAFWGCEIKPDFHRAGAERLANG